MAPNLVLLPGKSHGWRSPWGRRELDTTEQLHSLTHSYIRENPNSTTDPKRRSVWPGTQLMSPFLYPQHCRKVDLLPGTWRHTSSSAHFREHRPYLARILEPSSVFFTDFFSWSKSHIKCHLFREYTVNINLLHYCTSLHLAVSYLVFITLFIICSSGLWSVFLLSTHTHHGLERAMCPTCCFPFITQHITHTWHIISKPKYSKWMNT